MMLATTKLMRAIRPTRNSHSVFLHIHKLLFAITALFLFANSSHSQPVDPCVCVSPENCPCLEEASRVLEKEDVFVGVVSSSDDANIIHMNSKLEKGLYFCEVEHSGAIICKQSTAKVRKLTPRQEEALRLLEEGPKLCITDPCPVNRTITNVLGEDVNSIRVDIPGVSLEYFDVENSDGSRSYYVCEGKNLVEEMPEKSCKWWL